MGKLEGIDADVKGTIGADDPLQAFDDAIARFSPTHIVIGRRSADRAGWQEDVLIEALSERARLPITIFDIPDE